MTKSALLATAAVLALCAGGASAATHNTTFVRVVAPHHVIFGLTPGSGTLYDQNINDNGIAIVSQNFSSSVSIYDSQGADDFTVPKGHTWMVKEVDVSGVYFNGTGPATSENVQFYKDSGGLPSGKALVTCKKLNGIDTLGSFAIELPRSCKVKLGAGHYQVSVIANVGSGAGEWGWLTNNEVAKDPAAWQNQGGGFGICPTWDVMTTCIGDVGQGGDFAFALKGKDKTL